MMHGRSEARQTAASSPKGETNEVSESIMPRPTAFAPPVSCLMLGSSPKQGDGLFKLDLLD